MTEDQRRMRAAVETIETQKMEIDMLNKRCARLENALQEILLTNKKLLGEMSDMSGVTSIARQALSHMTVD